MARARIPDGAKIWAELNTATPTEVSYDARIPFSVCWVITDGIHRWKFLWINRRSSGVYIAHALPGGFHESCHVDGQRHWKHQGGEEVPLPNGQPLETFSGWQHLQSSTSNISSETLLGSGFSEFQDEPLEKIIYLDNRAFGSWLYTDIYLVEPFRHGDVPLHTGAPAFVHLITHTLPWIQVAISDGI